MAAGSDLLDEVFFNSEVDEKVVSDLVGSLESQLAASAAHHHHLAPRTPEVRAAAAGALGNHVVSGSPAGAAGTGAAAPAEGAPGAPPEPPPAGRARPGGGGPRREGPGSPRRPLAPAGPAAAPAAKLRPPPEGSAGPCAPVPPAAAAASAGPEPAAAAAAGPAKPAGPAAQTLNGGAALLNSHHAAPAVSLVNNGPAPPPPPPPKPAPGTVIQTPPFLGAPAVPAAAAPPAPAPAAPSPPAVPAPAAAPPPPPPAPATLARPPGHPAGPAPAAPPPAAAAAAQNGGSAGAAPAPAPAAGGPAGGSGQPGPGVPAAAPVQGVKAESPKTVVAAAAAPPPQTLAAGGAASSTAGMILGPTMQGALPSPGPGTPTGLPKGAAGAVPQNLPRTPTATTAGIRAALTPTVLAPRLPQPPQNPTNIQNFQLPPGMVLVRSENGQLLMIPQQALAQMQAQAHAQAQPQSTMAPRPATPTSAPPVQISTVQAPGTPIIARQVTPTTIIKQVSQAQTTVQPTTSLQRSPGVQPQLVLGGATQTAALGTATAVPAGAPQRTVPGASATTTAATETMENVKKCKNFLSTLIKLASSGKQSTETAANVKELVQSLLDGKIEAEDFTSRLYRELNSSPQPYLVPFLKRSLPALRQLTPDSAAFIQQSQQQPPPASQATTALTAVVLSSSGQRPAGKTAATVTNALQPPVISLAQPTQVGVGKQAQPAPLVIQQPSKPGALIRPPQVTLTQTPMVALRQPHSRIMLTAPQQVQLSQLQPVPVVKPAVLPGTKALTAASAQAAAAQKHKLKEPGGGSFRDDDDINDVASMAGVNLSEESARILATNSEIVGTLTRSCKDETFLLPAPLQRRILEIGKWHGITELHPDVVSYVSHATQQRLQNLVERISETAQQKNFSYKDDDRYEQASDVRAQLKFFEQLDQIEKQRKDEQEREILMRAAKSRSRQEDPEQLRLKQKAKEMQQQELAQLRQRDANLTALAAIGPRKKRRADWPGSTAGAEGAGPGSAVPGSSGVGTPRQFTRQRITRVNLRDLIFCLENERESSHSLLLYKALLK
ncbi:transcription initiation factor TFIID subunit 4 [Ochotona princeps]|uniref:transcription initiation factor TFIID subunit 4 n=1 Tax=Ochotona princeps TaxID=9978 RepID=UPI002714CFB0|nr:transcription initiation factor TFIID subunit 4 [Ochotona princeps]